MTPSPPTADHQRSAEPATGFHMQAIVVIHGMGEQKPMDTIKAFVRSVWTSDEAVHRNGLHQPGEVWSKPDMRTGSLELRRLTTRESTPSATFEKGSRQDFYELYWADLSGGSTWDQVKNWIGMLLLRNPFTRVPPDVRLAWYFCGSSRWSSSCSWPPRGCRRRSQCRETGRPG
jgi:hypothetical protein